MISISDINGFSKKGIRENNEDYIIYSTDFILPTQTRVIVLCDGMGGHGHGEVASKIVAESVFETLAHSSKEFSADDLQYALDNALITLNNVDTYNDSKKMGTTLVVAVINNNNVLVGHVGDSRCYLFDENCIKKFRTKDHSKVAEAVEAEILTEEEAFTSQYKNILTRSVMAGKMDVKIDIDRLDVNNKDRLLLCTDGIVDALRDDELAAILVNRNVDEALSMIDSVCGEKSHDNYSVIIADLHKESETTRCIGTNVLQGGTSVNFESDVDGSQKIDDSFKESVYNESRYQSKDIKRFLLCVSVGFVLALLLCGITAFFAFKRLDKITKEKERLWCGYRNKTSQMIKSVCSQTSDSDTVILKQKLLYEYEKIDSIYFHKPVKQIK